MAEGLKRAAAAARTTRPPTVNEARFLAGLTVSAPHIPAAPGTPGWWSVPELIAFQPERFGDRSPQGLHETGASCARKGWVLKRVARMHGKQLVEYQITEAGRAALGSAHQGGISDG
jgi:hypothetical protein